MTNWVYEEWTRPKYAGSHRHYHSYDHIDRLLVELENWRDKLTDDEYWAMKTAIVYHDVIWYPDRKDNEEESVRYAEYSGAISRGTDGDLVRGLIMATKAPFEPKTDLERLMVWLDWHHFLADDRLLHKINMQILREYQMYPIDRYIAARNLFFEHEAYTIPPKLICDRFISAQMAADLNNGILRADLMSRVYRPKIGVFVGSFNPFHDGHYATLQAAERVYDKVIVVQATSNDKAVNGPALAFPPILERYYETHRFLDGSSMKDILNVLTLPKIADYALIRGIRNSTDLTAEQTYARILWDMGVRTPIHHILSDAEHQHISSTAVRELRKLGHDLYTRVWGFSTEHTPFGDQDG